MEKKKCKFLAFLVSLIIFTSIFATMVQAAPIKKTLNVWFGNIIVKYNNSDITAKVSPIMVNGRTYLPMRSMAGLFNKDIKWNQQTKTVLLSDKTDSSVSTLNSQIADLKNQLSSKDAYAQVLLQKISTLESKSNSAASTSSSNTTSSSSSSASSNSSSLISITDLQDDLNDDYDFYKNADFEISLSGDENSVTISIKTNTNNWLDISIDNQKKYLQNIVDDILDEYKNANITGKVKDGSTSLVKFTVNSDGDVDIDSSSIIKDLKTTLNSKLKSNYLGTLTGIDNDNLEIVVEGDLDKLTFSVNLSLNTYQTQWDALSDSAIETFMKNVYDYISGKSNFEDTEIIGYFYDTSGKDNLTKLYKDSNSFKRY